MMFIFVSLLEFACSIQYRLPWIRFYRCQKFAGISLDSSEKLVEFFISEILKMTNGTPICSYLLNECRVLVQHCHFSQMGVDAWVDVYKGYRIGKCLDCRFLLSS